MSTIVVGVDIGTTKIACFIGKRGSTSGKVKILGFGRCTSNGVRYGVVENLQETSDAIKKAVEQASEQANVVVDEVYIGVAGMHIRSLPMEASVPIKQNTYQIISKEDVEELIATLRRTATTEEGEEIIHVFPQSYVVDNRPLSSDMDPVGVSGNVLKGIFNVVTGKISEISKLVNSVSMAGYKVKSVILEPVASSYAVLDEADFKDGIALVDIGGGTTDIAVIKDGSVRFTSVLAIAGSVITNDISSSCQLVRHLSEKLKVQFGSCLPSKVDPAVTVSIPMLHGQQPREINLQVLSGIIKPRVEQIFDLVLYELENSQLTKNIVNGIALTGGGANMKNIKDLAMYRTGIHCHIGTPGVHLEPLDNTDAQVTRMKTYDDPMYATGIGLVIYGVQEEEQQEERDQRLAEQKAEQQPDPIPDETPKPDEANPSIGNKETEKTNGRRGFRLFDPVANWWKNNFVDPMDET